MIRIKNLSFKYSQTSEMVLDEVNLTFKPGSLTLVTGASGTGKSTLLRCINGLVPHFSGGEIYGEVNVFDEDPISDGPQVLADKVGFVFQEPEAQFVFDTVEDEIAFALENTNIPPEEMHQRVKAILVEMKLSNLRKAKMKDLSGGEMQKVAIASALISEPQVLVLDEPTSQLDPISADEILQFIVFLKLRLGLTIIISEHRLERLLPYTDTIVHIQMDHKILSGAPQEILPKISQVPPIIMIAKAMHLTPLPLTPQVFSEMTASMDLPLKKKHSTNNSVPSECLIQVENLSMCINNKLILNDVSLDLFRGEILSLMGPNGAGKTSFLKALLGLIPSKGKRKLFDHEMDAMGLSAIIQHIAYLPQNPNDLLFADSVAEELQITLKNHNQSVNEASLSEFLARFSLAEKKQNYPRDLSVGERQRTALAAITVHSPEIILLDEPTRGLDYLAKCDLINIFKGWRDEGRAILLITHDIEFAAQLADRVAILEKGVITYTGNPHIAFSNFPAYRTQTAQLFPGTNWITPDNVDFLNL